MLQWAERCIYYLFFYFLKILLWLVYNVLSISAIQQSDPVTHAHTRAHTHTHTHTHIILTSCSLHYPCIILHHVPSQVIRYIVFCAIQQDLLACTFQMQEFSSTNLRFPIHPSPSPAPLHTLFCPTCPWSFLFCR